LAPEVSVAGFELPVDLSDVDPRLTGVMAMAKVDVLLGESGGRAAILGAVPDTSYHADAVREFASSLVTHEQISFAPVAAIEAQPSGGPNGADNPATHRVVNTRGAAQLTRVGFSCGCGCRVSSTPR
jgi:hypothetical protein